MIPTPQRGFTLLIAVILASVSLSVGLALLDIAYKQVLLASTAKQSQTSFYNADTALECALYWDQQQNAFDYTAPATTITCANTVLTVTATSGSSPRRRNFVIPCPGGSLASTTIYKWSSGTTSIFASGFNVCSSANPRRIERGLKVSF